MKYPWKANLAIMGVFIASLIAGVVACNGVMLRMPYGFEPQPSEGIGISLYFFVMIIAVTAVFFFLVKRKLSKFLKLWFCFVLFFSVSVALSVFAGEIPAVIVSLAIMLMYSEKDIYVKNLVHVLAFAGVSAVVSLSFNLLSIVVLLSAVALYDIVSVFFTKHMVALAKSQGKLGIFAGIIIPVKKSFAFLGGGDIVFPTILLHQIFRYFGAYSLAWALAGTVFGLFVLLYFGEEKKVYPAIPTIFSGALLGFLVSFF